jgi:TPR repeat protein
MLDLHLARHEQGANLQNRRHPKCPDSPATEWDRGGRPANRLLSGDDIAKAKAWAARRPKNAPAPTALHLDFIRASEEEAEARSNAQRKQLEGMAAAQAERETALRQAEEAQRKRATMARIRNIALVAVSMLAAIAVWLGWRAEQQRKVAEEQREQVDQILARAQNIVFQRLDHMDIATLKEVFAVYQMGADRGDANSMENLGMLYALGYGVTQDYIKAHEWSEKAAGKGHGGTMSNLGVLYEHGHGVTQDYVKAREWSEKAADKGDGDAMANLGGLYANGYGVAQDYAKAHEWFQKAADKGNARATFYLRLLYDNGFGVAQDYAKARVV